MVYCRKCYQYPAYPLHSGLCKGCNKAKLLLTCAVKMAVAIGVTIALIIVLL